VGYANPYDEIAIISEYLWRERATHYTGICRTLWDYVCGPGHSATET
jgi:hypothetical protein